MQTQTWLRNGENRWQTLIEADVRQKIVSS
jgi:hypothetical protein